LIHAIPESSQLNLNVWFNDFEPSIDESIVRASVEKKRSRGGCWGRLLGAQDYPEGCEGGRWAGEDHRLKREVPAVKLTRQIPS